MPIFRINHFSFKTVKIVYCRLLMIIINPLQTQIIGESPTIQQLTEKRNQQDNYYKQESTHKLTNVGGGFFFQDLHCPLAVRRLKVYLEDLLRMIPTTEICILYIIIYINQIDNTSFMGIDNRRIKILAFFYLLISFQIQHNFSVINALKRRI